jgi:hypothetical protein
LEDTSRVQVPHAPHDPLPLAGGVLHFLAHLFLLALQLFVPGPKLRDPVLAEIGSGAVLELLAPCGRCSSARLFFLGGIFGSASLGAG